MNKQMQKGFTLIELMVVIVIIGILAAIAIPSYLDNANRAKITEGINLMSPVKSGVSESYIAAGQMPANHAQAGLLATSASYATGVVKGIGWVPSASTNADQGAITITYDEDQLGADVNGTTNTLVFGATGSAKGVEWFCTDTEVTAAGLTPGTLLDKYRPANCRG